MTIEKIAITDRAQWLSLRKQDVTASVAGALLGVHDYLTPFELWGLKKGLITEDPMETAPMRRGRLLEPVVAEMIREERPDWRLEKPTHYYRDPARRIGATPDLFAFTPEGRKINIQLKTTHELIFKQKWLDRDTRTVEAPTWIAVQSLIEHELTQSDDNYVACMVIGMGLDLKLIEVPPHAGVQRRIGEEVKKFWSIIDSGETMAPDYARDGEALAKLYSAGGDPDVDLSDDAAFASLIGERDRLKGEIDDATDALDAVKAAVKHRLGNAAVARCGSRMVTWKTQEKKGYEVKPCSGRVLLFK